MRGMRLVLMMVTVALMFGYFPMTAAAGETVYTYFYDYWEDERESPDTYKVSYHFDGEMLGVDSFDNAQSIFVKNNLLYICDTGKNRIIIADIKDQKYELVEVIDSFEADDDTLNTFLSPNDIFVNDAGDMYICDTENQRIVQLNSRHELVQVFTRPQDNTISETADFLPLKIVVDDGGRLFVLVKNYNKGFVQFKPNGDFAGYMGANEVKFDMLDYIWKLFATKEQRSQMEQFVPTEYNNLALDDKGFIYCTTSVFDENELRADKAKPIRKLNAVGSDILIKNGNFPPIGDIKWSNTAGISGASKLVDITVMDNETYYAIDKTRGRIFGYDAQGNMLYAFGGLGNRLGYFQYPVAIEHSDRDLLILDAKSGDITCMTLTAYGALINEAIDAYQAGSYEQSAAYWDEVLMYNGNYDQAYIGLGRAALRQGDYQTAMAYFELKYDEEHYSKAFMLSRKDWIEANIGWILLFTAMLVGLPTLIKIYKVIRQEVREYEHKYI